MKKIMKYITVIFGLLLMAISFNLFQEPFNFAAGGVTGLSIILHKFINIDESVFIFIINQSLIIVSFLVLGKKKTINTILGSILLPILIKMTSFMSFYNFRIRLYINCYYWGSFIWSWIRINI